MAACCWVFALSLSLSLSSDRHRRCRTDVYFVTDIFLNFRTAFRDEDDELIIEYDQIRHHYLHGWFTVDLVACLPVTYVALILDAAGAASGTGGQVSLCQRSQLCIIPRLRCPSPATTLLWGPCRLAAAQTQCVAFAETPW